jgi:hypothetical protein
MLDYDANCDACGYTARLRHILRSYKCGDGLPDRVTIEQAPAWCAGCRAVVSAETIPGVDTIQRDIDSCTDADDESQEHLDRLRRRLAWRKERQAGPKCLECGSQDLAFVRIEEPEDEELDQEEIIHPMEHPGCGGTLAIVNWNGFSLNRLWIFYTPDGDKIDTFEASPSKGLVKPGTR